MVSYASIDMELKTLLEDKNVRRFVYLMKLRELKLNEIKKREESCEDQAIAHPLQEIVIGIERQKAGTAGSYNKRTSKTGQYHNYVFPIISY